MTQVCNLVGPHSIASFATEWRAYLVNTWGTMNLPKQDLLALVDDQGRHLVQVKHKMANQKGTTLCTAAAEIRLPKKSS